MLRALADGETDPRKLAALADDRLQCSEKQLIDALSGSPQPVHLQLLALYLDRHQMLDVGGTDRHAPLPVSPAVTVGLGTSSLTGNDKMTTRRIFQRPVQERPAPGLHGNVSV
jgi:hypothetical protein